LLGRFLNKLLAGMAVLAGLLLLFIAFSISYAIFTRAAGFQSPVWTVQFNEYALLWMTFLGSAWVLSRRKHVAVDVVTANLGPMGKRIAEVAHSLLGIGVCGILCWYSAVITLNLFQRGVMDVQAVDIPKHLVLMVIPAGFLVLLVQFFRNLAISLRRGRPATREAGQEASSLESPERTPEGRKG